MRKETTFGMGLLLDSLTSCQILACCFSNETYHSNGSFSISGGGGGQANPTAGNLCGPDSITGSRHSSLALRGLTFLICTVRGHIVSMVFSSVDTVYDVCALQ